MDHTSPAERANGRVTGTAAVVNPTAGGGRAGSTWKEIVRRLPELGEAHLVQGTEEGAIRAELAQLIERGVDRIVVLGGDGSMHLVGNVILDLGHGADVGLGMVPLGTGSDLPRALGLPKDPHACAAHVLSVAPRPMDALELTTRDGRRRFVMNVASAGISGLVDEAVNAMPQRGATAYLRATLAALMRYRPVPCRVQVDGKPWYEGGITLLAIGNGTSFGRGMQVAPRARIDDGELDVVLVLPLPRWQLLFRLARLYGGTHLETEFVRWCRGRTVEIEPLAPLPPFDLDGEVFASGAARIRVLPGALRILA
jgi:diacylglycerol kinase (ATP)